MNGLTKNEVQGDNRAIANRNTLKAVSSLVGTIVGGGIFGVPFVFARAGFLPATLVFAAITAIVLFLHLMYGEVVERTEGKHRLMGYVEVYFGKRAKHLIAASVIIGAYGASVAYILLAGEFLSRLLGFISGNVVVWGLLFWGVLSVAIIKGIRTIARIEVFMFTLLVLVFLVIFSGSIPSINLNNFTFTNWSNIFLPYGVILFALVGLQAIPEIHSVIKNDGKKFVRSIIFGSLIAAFITFLFGAAVLGVSGIDTSNEAISGLTPFVGKWILYTGASLGVLAVATSYLIFGVNLKETFIYDWNIKKSWSNAAAVLVPGILVILGVRSFIEVIGVTGAFFGAVNGSAIALMFTKAKTKGKKSPHFNLRIPKLVVWIVILALLTGGVYEIIKVLAR